MDYHLSRLLLSRIFYSFLVFDIPESDIFYADEVFIERQVATHSEASAQTITQQLCSFRSHQKTIDKEGV